MKLLEEVSSRYGVPLLIPGVDQKECPPAIAALTRIEWIYSDIEGDRFCKLLACGCKFIRFRRVPHGTLLIGS